MTDLKRATVELAKNHALILASLPDGFDAFCIADLTRALAPAAEDRAVVLVHVARDGQRARAFNEALGLRRAGNRGARFPRLGLPAL